MLQHIATAAATRGSDLPGNGLPGSTMLSRRRVRGRGARGQRVELWRVEDSSGREGDGSTCHDGDLLGL